MTDTKLGYVSRTEGISSGPREIALDDTGHEAPETPSTALAFASMREVPVPQAGPARPCPRNGPGGGRRRACLVGETPFYKKMFSSVTNLQPLGAEPVAETAQVASPPFGCPAQKPVPQKRAQAPPRRQCGCGQLSRTHYEKSKARHHGGLFSWLGKSVAVIGNLPACE